MIKLAAKLKMKEEGLRREAIYKNGQYQDIYEYGVLRTEYFN
jgi:RimJ/RimL family protein N-acetyltransferase